MTVVRMAPLRVVQTVVQRVDAMADQWAGQRAGKWVDL
jgi:hypothetical protein